MGIAPGRHTKFVLWNKSGLSFMTRSAFSGKEAADLQVQENVLRHLRALEQHGHCKHAWDAISGAMHTWTTIGYKNKDITLLLVFTALFIRLLGHQN